MDLIRSRAFDAFGTRLRRLSERLDRDVQAVYRAHAVDFEPRWYPVVMALNASGQASVGELADALGVTHAAVSQVRAELVRRGLVSAEADPADQRRQVLRLTEGGRALAAQLQPIWAAVARAAEELCAENAPRLIEEIDRLEQGLADAGFRARIERLLTSSIDHVEEGTDP